MTYTMPAGIPSYEEAQTEAAKGNVYCWLCASDHVHKVSRAGMRKQFECNDCGNYINYTISDEVYKAIDKRKNKKSRST